MKFKTINVSESIETYHSLGLKKWRKIDACVELSDGDNEDEAYEMASKKVVQWHKQSGSILEINYEALNELPTTQKDPKQLQIQLHIDTINSYTDKERLIKIYAPLVEKTPELKEAYETKLNLLNQIK